MCSSGVLHVLRSPPTHSPRALFNNKWFSDFPGCPDSFPGFPGHVSFFAGMSTFRKVFPDVQIRFPGRSSVSADAPTSFQCVHWVSCLFCDFPPHIPPNIPWLYVSPVISTLRRRFAMLCFPTSVDVSALFQDSLMILQEFP